MLARAEDFYRFEAGVAYPFESRSGEALPDE